MREGLSCEVACEAFLLPLNLRIAAVEIMTPVLDLPALGGDEGIESDRTLRRFWSWRLSKKS